MKNDLERNSARDNHVSEHRNIFYYVQHKFPFIFVGPKKKKRNVSNINR